MPELDTSTKPTGGLLVRGAGPHPVTGCYCAEGAVIEHGRLVSWCPPVHNCSYIRQRNGLMNEAAQRATSAMRQLGKDISSPEWSLRFSQAMVELAAERLSTKEA